jgi:hypothetical protein
VGHLDGLNAMPGIESPIAHRSTDMRVPVPVRYLHGVKMVRACIRAPKLAFKSHYRLSFVDLYLCILLISEYRRGPGRILLDFCILLTLASQEYGLKVFIGLK